MKSQAELQPTIRQYLLGTLSQEQLAEFEERLLTDGGLYDELLMAEDELIDQFLSGALSATERERIESHFLRTPERQEHLRFASTLRRYVSANQPQVDEVVGIAQVAAAEELPQIAVTPHRKRSFLSTLFPRSPALAFSLACALLLVIAGGVWLAISLRRQTNWPQSFFAVELAPGLTRSGEIMEFAIPPEYDVVRLQLDLPEDQYPSYEAVSQDAGGRTLTTNKNLKAQSATGRPAVFVDVRRSLLPPGNYRVKLSGLTANGNAENVGSYSFRVLKQ